MKAVLYQNNIYYIIDYDFQRFAFTTNPQDLEKTYVYKLKEKGYQSRSGCFHGPKLLGRELWRVTELGKTEILYPLLLKCPFYVDFKDVPFTHKLVSQLDDSTLLVMLYQIGWFEGWEWLGKLAAKDYTFFKLYPRLVPFFVYARVVVDPYHNVVYMRSNPESFLFFNGLLRLPAPKVSIKNIRLLPANPGFRLDLGRRHHYFYCFKEPDHLIVYHVISEDLKMTSNTIIHGYEVYKSIKHPPCRLSPYFFNLNQLKYFFYHRLGDVIFLPDDEAKKYGPDPLPADSEQLEKIEELGHNLLYHPEHGVIEIGEDYKPYPVEYIDTVGD